MHDQSYNLRQSLELVLKTLSENPDAEVRAQALDLAERLANSTVRTGNTQTMCEEKRDLEIIRIATYPLVRKGQRSDLLGLLHSRSKPGETN